MPTLFILAGPNGAGKTTYYTNAIEQNFIDPHLPFINVDLIALKELGGYTEENFAQANLFARERIGRHLKSGEDFMIESNLAVQSNYDWIENVIKQGYNVILYFLCTSLLTINIERIQERVLEGGHYIPDNIVEHRYKMGLTYLKSKIFIFKEVYLIDTTYDTAQLMTIIKDGKIELKNSNSPAWVNDVLFLFEKLMEKNK